MVSVNTMEPDFWVQQSYDYNYTEQEGEEVYAEDTENNWATYIQDYKRSDLFCKWVKADYASMSGNAEAEQWDTPYKCTQIKCTQQRLMETD